MNTGAPIVRIAPSPTGNLHIGTARSALFNFLYARKYGGTFILRIEDTDRERSTKAYEEDILEGLTWLRLTWDALYRQSERTSIYREQLEKLVASGKALVSKEESKDMPGEYTEVIRLKNPGTVVTFTDRIHGDITFNTKELGDFVIARSISDPLYHFAVVVDDALMGVTDVIRGEDHISNTPRQILIQEALGYRRPSYAHIPLILASDRSKLSKRKGATSIADYRKEGYLSEALVNFLALMGWNPGTEQEIFSLYELIDTFSVEKVHASGAVFNVEKLNWFNRAYLAKLAPETFVEELKKFLPEGVTKLSQYSEERLARALPHIRERMDKLADIQTLLPEFLFFFEAPTYDASQLSWKEETPLPNVREHLTTVTEALGNIPEEQFGAETAKAAVWDYATEVGRGAVLWPMRYALSGKEKSPDPFSLAEALGKPETLTRLKTALESIERNDHAS